MRVIPTTFGPTSQAMADIPPRPEAPLTVAASDCLLGAPVRFDGGHKKSALPHAELAGLFEFRGFCPEVAIGLGTPREAMRLEGEVGQPQAISIKARTDYTEQLQAEAERVVPQLADVSGYVFMKSSPSCGLFRVKVYSGPGIPFPSGRGIYAQRLSEKLPDLPLEECGRLHDPVLRENFVMRTFVFAHWQRLLAADLTAAKLVEFHSRYKYLLMAHSITHYKSAGRLLSDLSTDLPAVAATYFATLIEGLTKPATRGGHANVLSHLQGYVKRSLPGTDRQELAQLIDDYRAGKLPLLAPLTLLRHHLQHYADDYALQQIYLDPHPSAAGLRREL